MFILLLKLCAIAFDHQLPFERNFSHWRRQNAAASQPLLHASWLTSYCSISPIMFFRLSLGWGVWLVQTLTSLHCQASTKPTVCQASTKPTLPSILSSG
jgi:hypothetical protein